jgi:glycosyltransferase involved in cell wall biosynthesis
VRIVHVNATDILDGAARAVYRLHKGLQAAGADSQMFVMHAAANDATVRAPQGIRGKLTRALAPPLNRAMLWWYPHRPYQRIQWSVNWFPYPSAGVFNRLQADIIHLHWIGSGTMPIASLPRLRSPILWTLHDEWAMTGGCHYAGSCQGFQLKCGKCPQLASAFAWDLSRFTWHWKHKHWSRLRLSLVAPSRWMAERAKQSSLLHDFPIRVIPNGIDTSRYRPLERQMARGLLGLPLAKQLILFGAMSGDSDPRKGFQYLQPALQKLALEGWAEKAELIVFGASKPQTGIEMGIPIHYLGYLFDDLSLALVYSAADVFVAPSVEDNLPNTVMEALACGVPAVAFSIGGMADLIEHEATGYLAQPLDPNDLAHGLGWVLEDRERYSRLAERARHKVETEFAVELVARQYLDLYAELVLARQPKDERA